MEFVSSEVSPRTTALYMCMCMCMCANTYANVCLCACTNTTQTQPHTTNATHITKTNAQNTQPQTTHSLSHAYTYCHSHNNWGPRNSFQRFLVPVYCWKTIEKPETDLNYYGNGSTWWLLYSHFHNNCHFCFRVVRLYFWSFVWKRWEQNSNRCNSDPELKLEFFLVGKKRQSLWKCVYSPRHSHQYNPAPWHYLQYTQTKHTYSHTHIHKTHLGTICSTCKPYIHTYIDTYIIHTYIHKTAPWQFFGLDPSQSPQLCSMWSVCMCIMLYVCECLYARMWFMCMYVYICKYGCLYAGSKPISSALQHVKCLYEDLCCMCVSVV
jgi:hypothetical protein